MARYNLVFIHVNVCRVVFIYGTLQCASVFGRAQGIITRLVYSIFLTADIGLRKCYLTVMIGTSIVVKVLWSPCTIMLWTKQLADWTNVHFQNHIGPVSTIISDPVETPCVWCIETTLKCIIVFFTSIFKSIHKKRSIYA